MNKYTSYYTNKVQDQCVTIPSKQGSGFLQKEKYLSEFSSQEEINEVLNNLGLGDYDQYKFYWDNSPTRGHFDYLVNSDGIYQMFQKYYTKEDIDKLIENLQNGLPTDGTSINIVVDAQLSDYSTNPVQNKVLKASLDEKVDYSILSNYVTTSDLNKKVDQINKDLEKGKGYFSSYQELIDLVPIPETGDWAVVNSNGIFYIAKCTSHGIWTMTSQEYEIPELDLTAYAKKSDLEEKQDKLVSGINIKTINGQPIVGSGNIQVSGEGIIIDDQLSSTSSNPVENKVVKTELDKKANQTDLDTTLQELNNKITGVNTKLEKGKGYFTSEEALLASLTNPEVGDWAIVNKDGKWVIASCQKAGLWTITEQEYEQAAVELNEYVKKTDLEKYATKEDLKVIPIVSSDNNGLMSSSMLKTLNELSDIYPELQENLQNIYKAIGTNEQEVINKFNTISDFINSLNSDNQDSLLESIINIITQEKTRAQESENNLQKQINSLQSTIQNLQIGEGGIKHIILEESEYSTLTTYEDDAIYFVLENKETPDESWKLGDKFPIILI